ncbi:MAG: hypothetical protein RLZZ385_836 [Pseudomonadota bacterium]
MSSSLRLLWVRDNDMGSCTEKKATGQRRGKTNPRTNVRGRFVKPQKRALALMNHCWGAPRSKVCRVPLMSDSPNPAESMVL